MKPKVYNLLDKCVADGARLGVDRAYKHNDNPSRQTIEHEVYEAITNEICEWFDFEDIK